MKLNDLMEYDHVIQVHADGDLSEPRDVYAPEVHVDTDADGQILAEHDAAMVASVKTQGWELMSGYTGQYLYHGPVMHPSEYIGGQLEQDIRETPGYYVAVTVETDGGESAGWVVARKDVA